ncbi:sensor histidine kinase [Streptacidiphilus sp. PB12-B1b]|uniref:ATP-binding protein n=1 Tax=Streptacidiphilus sp. PB12-B1b TaxID=2705012 RepID=UPI0015FC5219|nr:ATP-binding protein [Streptacidiphilus sp. PB12-B1b]QMU77713.1 sensor histidine kinase [Streptacidiphilus sp. PB12-B1b]
MTQIPEVATALLAAGTAGSLVTVPLLLTGRRRTAAARREADAARLDAAAARLDAAAAHTARDQAHGELQSAAARFEALRQENQHLAAVRIPALVQRLTHHHLVVPGPLHPELAESGTAAEHDAVLAQIARALADARRQVDAAAAAVMRGATSSLQALGYRQQSLVSSLQLAVDEPRLAEQLFALDRLNEQSLRRIQATGVLCGAWPGLNREDSHLPDILAGAQGRVEDSRRIVLVNQLHRAVGAVGRVVEPLAMVVAELMANAVYYSQGTLAVRVSLHHAAHGVCVVVDDAGIGMHDDDIAFAERMMHPDHQSRLSELGDPPRAGFATIGRLAREYGFSVSVRGASQYGGVHAVVLIPQRLLVLMDEAQPMSAVAPPPARGIEPEHASAAALAPAPRPAADPAFGPAPDPGAVPRNPAAPPPLPQRHRHRAADPAPGDPAGPPPPERQPPTLGQTASAWSAVQSGTDQGREAAPVFRERNES